MKIIITEENIEMNGNPYELLAGLSCLVQALQKNDISKDLIQESVELGFMSDEELNMKSKELDMKKKEEEDKLLNLLKKIFE